MATIRGTAKRDALHGTAVADILYAYQDADTLDGGAGADLLVGGGGSDTYIVDQVGDKTTEKWGEGIDVVRSLSKVYKLGSYIENLVYAGTGAFIGTGNVLGNVITGGGGNDTLDGYSGNDTINGGAGADRLIGGLGADRMAGGVGNDVYFDGTGDTVVEAAGAGNDTVKTTRGSYSLGTNLENLVFVGSGIFLGTGNAVANIITGGAGADRLNGGAGADTLTGNGGDDTFVVDNAGDVVKEVSGGGLDEVTTTLGSYALGSAVENLAFIGTGDFAGTGNGIANRIVGGAGNDRLDGRAGVDRLVGGLGDDTYVVDNLADFDPGRACRWPRHGGDGARLVDTVGQHRAAGPPRRE